MGSELSFQSCVTDFQSCSLSEGDSVRPAEKEEEVRIVQLKLPFGMTLHSQEYLQSLVKTVYDCEPNGNAAAAGVEKNMILMQINGVDVQHIELDTLNKVISSLPLDKAITCTFLSPRGDRTSQSAKIDKSPTLEGSARQGVAGLGSEGEVEVATVGKQGPPASANKVKCPEKNETDMKEEHVICGANPTPVIPASSASFSSTPSTSSTSTVVATPQGAAVSPPPAPVHPTTTTTMRAATEARSSQDRPPASGTVAAVEEKDLLTGKKMDFLSQVEALAAAVDKTELLNLEKEEEIAKLKAEHEEIQKIKTQLQQNCKAVAELYKAASQETPPSPSAAPLALALAAQDSFDDTLSLGSFTIETGCDDVSLLDENESGSVTRCTDRDGNKLSGSGCMLGSSGEAERLCDIISLSEAISPNCDNSLSREEKNLISTCMMLLRGGIQVKKHNLSVGPSSKWLHVDPEFKKLYWRNEVDTGFKRAKSFQSNALFGKSDCAREVAMSDILEVCACPLLHIHGLELSFTSCRGK